MRISTKGGYGPSHVRTGYTWAGPVPLKTVAERQSISEHYLEQLMGMLRRAGLVRGIRGFEVAMSRLGTEAIRWGMLRLGGPISPISRVDHDGFSECALEQCPPGGLKKLRWV